MAAIRVQRDALLERIKVYEDDIIQLDARIANLTTQLANAERLDSLGQDVIQLYRDRLADALQTRKDLELMVSNLEKDLRKARRKAFWVGVAGAAAGIAGFILYVTK